MQNEQTVSGPESIVTSLEMSKRLKEAGWPQDNSCFVLHDVDGVNGVITPRGTHATYMLYDTAMPTAEEIENSLRDEDGDIPNVEVNGKWYMLHKSWDYYSLIGLEDKSDILKEFPRDARHENGADLVAEVYCYLAEKNLLPTP